MTAAPSGGVSTAYANLPFAAELRSASALSERLGLTVRPRRIRVKPGHSAIVAWQREGASDAPGRLGGFDDWGWTAVVTCGDKLFNIQRRAEGLGQPIIVHAAADPRSAGVTGGVLLSGTVLSDAKLGRQIARALNHLDGRVEVIGYNPGRRLLLRHSQDAGPAEFVRIGAGSQKHLVESAAQWADWNLPTLPVTYLGGRHTAVRSPWWGVGDLESHPDAGLAEEVGVVIAELHRRAPAEVVHPVLSSPLEQVEKSVGVLRRLLPEFEVALTEALNEVQNRLGPDCAEGNGGGRAVHGDLSPDQVLVSGAECRIIDLDRAGIGPIGMDLGRWVAACRNLHSTIGSASALGLESAFLHGYRQAGGAEVDLEAWAAWALLVTALEPWRSCDPDWKERAIESIDHARAVLDGIAVVRDGKRVSL